MKHYKWVDPPSKTVFPMAAGGVRFIIAAAFVTGVFALIGCTVLTLISLLATAFICWFFRDPDRLIPDEDKTVVSPADGKIIISEKVENSPLDSGACLKVSIFMSVFNVHVNRLPCSGTVEKILYYPGKFFNASLDKASDQNEHNALFLETDNGQRICVIQIAGLVARRIICDIKVGEKGEQGQRFGMICFGSRLDVYLPLDTQIDVSCGDKVKAGTSILAHLS